MLRLDNSACCLSKQKLVPQSLTLSQTSPVFACLHYKSFETTVGKGEIAHNEQFLLSPHCFHLFGKLFMPYSLNLKLSFVNSFSLKDLVVKNLLFGKVITISEQWTKARAVVDGIGQDQTV